MVVRKISFLLFASLISILAKSQDTITTKKGLHINVLPIIFYLPETSLAFGGAGVATFRTADNQKRASVVQFVTDYTLNKQLTFTTVFDLFLKQEDWRLIGELSYFRYKYNFFGLGINALKTDLDKFQATYPRVKFAAYKQIKNSFKTGLLFQYDGIKSLSYEPSGIIDRSNYLGKNGGAVSNLGVGFLIDKRDNTLAASKGYFIEGQVFNSNTLWGAEFEYSKFTLDGRHYIGIYKQFILASNVYVANIFGDAPIYDLYSFGSGTKSRGVDDRRYRDKTFLVGQSEFRFPIIWKLRGAVFGSLASVSSSLDGVFNNRFVPSYGLGLRYELNKVDRSMLRFDIGRSEGEINFYVTTNEAF
jgi:hypothetical protein